MFIPAINGSRERKPTNKTTCPLLASYISSQKTAVNVGIGSRNVPTAPERVLDAPGLVDDFYLNVLEWGRRNFLGVALGGSVYLWNGQDSSVKELMSLPEPLTPVAEAAYISSLRWIHDGSSLGIGTSDGYVQIWDVLAGKKMRTIRVNEDGVRVASLAWNKHLLSTGDRSGVVRTFDVRLPKPLVLLPERRNTQEICGLEWSPDGSQLASGSNDNFVQIWDADSPVARHAFTDHKSAVKALAWCPWKSALLATGGGSQDRQIRTWNTISGECLSTVNADSTVSSLVWSKTSRELVSAHGHPKNHVQFWRQQATSTLTCRLVPTASIQEAHAARILHMTLSPDGRTLVTAGADESIKFWKAFDEEDDDGSGKPRKGKGLRLGTDGRQTSHVLMPKLSTSAAVSRAINRIPTV